MSKMPQGSDSKTNPGSGQVASIGTPINLLLLGLTIVFIYYRLRPSPAVQAHREEAPAVFRRFTPPDLTPYNGQGGRPIYLSIHGKVYDVTPGRAFYGPEGPYKNFAGRDASRGLACGSFDDEMLTKDLQGPLDRLEDLSDDQQSALADWEAKFDEKYLVVGSLVSVDDAAKETSS